MPVGGEFAAVDLFELRGQLGILGFVAVEHRVPFCVEHFAARADALAEIGEHFAGYQELFVFGPTVGGFCQADFFLAQRGSVGFVAVGFVGSAETDYAADDNHGRPVGGEGPRPLARIRLLQVVRLVRQQGFLGCGFGIAECVERSAERR